MSSLATEIAASQAPQLPQSRGRSGLLRRLARHKLAMMGLIIVLLAIVIAITAPQVAPYDYREQNLRESVIAPSWKHWLGTDVFGRDVLSRIMWGGRISLLVAFSAVTVGMIIGGVVGVVTGYVGGFIDMIGMRIVDTFLAIPALYLMMVLVGVFGPGTFMTILAIGLTFWTRPARILRAEILSIKERDYVMAARVVGSRPLGIILRHILPNAISPLIVQATLFSAQAIIIEAGLSFLGLGVQPPLPSWGSILSEGRRELLVAPWITTFPGITIFITVLGFNFLGDGLRDALDPKASVIKGA